MVDVVSKNEVGQNDAVVPVTNTSGNKSNARAVVVVDSLGAAANPPVAVVEDAAAAANPSGTQIMLRRRDALVTNEVSTEGDVIAANATSRGEQTVAIIGGTYTDRSIANLAGTSETLMAANTARRVLMIYNIGATAIGVNLTGGTASLTVGGSVNLAAGGSLLIDTYPPTGAITIIGTLNADVTAYEG